MKGFFKDIFSSTGSVVRVTIMSIVMACIVVSFYYQISHRFSSNEEPGSMENELEVCLTQDFVRNYPSDPKEVIRWYNRIITLLYGEDLKKKQIEDLGDQIIILTDRELASDNPRDVYLSRLKQEIQVYKDHNRKIINHDVGSVKDIRYVTAPNGDDLAYVTSYYFVQEASSYNTIYQTYCLRRDGSGKFKILAYERTDEKGNKLN